MAKTTDKAAVANILKQDYDAIIIGSGFGASVAITTLAEKGYKVLVLERGTWWRNPEGPAERDPSNKPPYKILGKYQYWPRPNTSKGINYLMESVYKEVPYLWDAVNPLIKDRDLGFRRNRKGLYRVTRFEHRNGNVDVISGSGVGGGSLFYSGVNLIPKDDVLRRIGLNHLTPDDFDRAGRWMLDYRGRMNKVFTTIPTPHWEGTESELQTDPSTLAPEYEMLHRKPLEEGDHEDYLYVPRARALRRAEEAAAKELKAIGGVSDGWHPLPLSIVEMDRNPWQKGDDIPRVSENFTELARALKEDDTTVALVDSSALESGGEVNQEINLLVGDDSGPLEIIKLKSRTNGSAADEFVCDRGVWHSSRQNHKKKTKVWRIFRGESDNKNTFCLRESRCTFGCLPSARHTLYKTIQKVALKLNERRDNGDDVGRIEVLPLSKVSHVLPADGGGYEVHFEMFLEGSEGWKKKSAPRVFFGAGVLGTVEILLRSKKLGMPLSDNLGSGFSTNGDIFGFATKVDRYKADGVTEKRPRDRKKVNATVGPINSSGVNITFNTEKGSDKQIHVNLEDTGVPPMLAEFAAAIEPGLGNFKTLVGLAKAAFRSQVLGKDPFDPPVAPAPEEREQQEYMTARELLSDLFFYTGMGAGPDEPLGVFSLDNDDSGLKLAYPGQRKLHEWTVFEKAIKTMKILSEKMNCRSQDFRLSPLWTFRGKKRVTVVHPLGDAALEPVESTPVATPTANCSIRVAMTTTRHCRDCTLWMHP